MKNMANLILQENLYWLLLQVGIRSKRGLIELAEKYDLTSMQLITLCSIGEGASIPMNSVSEFLVCDKSNVTGIVERLVGLGYMRREENLQDRRLKMLSLTPKGVRLCREILQQLPSYGPTDLEVLSGDEQRQLRHLLVRALEAHTGNTTPEK
jgi:MarR family transcriptional regulator, organic hydroperoxide resistance regulator